MTTLQLTRPPPRARASLYVVLGANVDSVSGATQTSESHVDSLQAAIDAKGA